LRPCSLAARHAVDRQCPTSGLVGLDAHAEHPFGLGTDIVQAVDQLDAAGLATTTGMNLGLDHPLSPADLVCRLDRLVGSRGQFAARHGNPVLLKQFLGLIFMKIHC
jgi:hypothetical protein